MSTIIHNARVVLPSGIESTSIKIDKGRIVHIGVPAGVTADETVDAKGMILMPGVIDDQVHFREPGLTHKEDIHTGSVGCAKGGVTTFLEMPNTNPNTINRERLEEKLAIGARTSVVNYGFYMGATPTNVADLKAARRTPGIKIFMGSSTGSLLVDEQEALEQVFAETSLPICAHCEDEATVRANAERLGGGTRIEHHSQIRDHAAAAISARRAIDLSRRHRHPFHLLHVSTVDELAELAAGADAPVTAEVCPHHLYFCIDDYTRLGSLVQMNPSIKTRADNEAMWKALAEGRIQAVATDHAPHTLEEKQRPYPASPSGLPAVENVLALMLDGVSRGRLTMERMVDAMCDVPARIWNIVGKGRIAEGYDADLVLVDPNRRHVIRNADQLTKCGWTPWDGVELKGLPVRTWVMGRTVFAEGVVDRTARGEEARFAPERGGYHGTVRA